jgi:hypothetical protein
MPLRFASCDRAVCESYYIPNQFGRDALMVTRPT